jgi:ribulose-5-phosphate 4-epimerase/fuculose-1-phosphate aldolase
MGMEEGYVKSRAEHQDAPVDASAIAGAPWKELDQARTRLHDLGLIGALASGVGFGNVSIRGRGAAFLISGTATGAARVLPFTKYCLVRSCDIPGNRVRSTGPIQASSESMTHGAIYHACPLVHCVMHIHGARIFDGMLRDRYPATPAEAAFGTPAIAAAIDRLLRESGRPEGVAVLAGHSGGVIAYGQTVDETLGLVVDLYNRYGN